MRAFIAALALVILPTQAGDVILRADGSMVEAQRGQRAVFVTSAPGTILVEIKSVQAVVGTPEPKPKPDPNGGCTPEGELGLGGEPCPE